MYRDFWERAYSTIETEGYSKCGKKYGLASPSPERLNSNVRQNIELTLRFPGKCFVVI